MLPSDPRRTEAPQKKATLWSGHLEAEARHLQSNMTSPVDVMGRVRLPSTILEAMLKEAPDHLLPSPLTFRISLPGKEDKDIYVGVLEFSGAEGRVELSRDMYEYLQLGREEDRRDTPLNVSVEQVELPQGTWARLVPEEGDVLSMAHIKPTLEASLRTNYTALYVGCRIWAAFGGKRYAFQVLELKPEQAISVVDTDLEVELVSHTLADQTIGKGKGKGKGPDVSEAEKEPIKPIEMGIPVHRQFHWDGGSGTGRGKSHHHILQVPEATPIDIHLVSEGASLETWCSLTAEVPTVDELWWWKGGEREGPLHIPLDSVAYRHYDVIYITVHSPSPLYGEAGPIEYTLEVRAAQEGTLPTSSSEPVEQAMGVVLEGSSLPACPTCGKHMPEMTLLRHERACARETRVCEQCGERTNMAGRAEARAHVHCPDCALGMEAWRLDRHREVVDEDYGCTCGAKGMRGLEAYTRHRRETCPDILMLCRYCRVLQGRGPLSEHAREVQLGMSEHEVYCGGRTIRCVRCGAGVRMRDVGTHAAIHEMERKHRPPPFRVCRNRQCIRAADPGSPLELCSVCFGPFWSPVHDPGLKRLRQRMALRYHTQLTEGCGKSWCRNEYCATGRPGGALGANESAAMLPPLLSLVPGTERHFCVNEETSRVRFFVDMLMEGGAGTAYDVAWVIRAVTEGSEDLEVAERWLRMNATPKTKA